MSQETALLPNLQKSTSHRFPGALGANLERFWSPTWPQTTSIMQPSWVSRLNSSSKCRQPRSIVNNTSRAIFPGPADHSYTTKNRSQDLSICRFLSFPFQKGVEALPRGLLETVFFEIYDFRTPTWGSKFEKKNESLRHRRVFLAYFTSSRIFCQHGGQHGRFLASIRASTWSY